MTRRVQGFKTKNDMFWCGVSYNKYSCEIGLRTRPPAAKRRLLSICEGLIGANDASHRRVWKTLAPPANQGPFPWQAI